jgi:hypothetical protein
MSVKNTPSAWITEGVLEKKEDENLKNLFY